MTEHKLHDRDDGLAHCMVCGGAEGSMPTECPGVRMTPEQEQAVYDGRLNYAMRQWWVPLASTAHLSICASQDDTMRGHPNCDCGATDGVGRQ
jgi:hypothetical protein